MLGHWPSREFPSCYLAVWRVQQTLGEGLTADGGGEWRQLQLHQKIGTSLAFVDQSGQREVGGRSAGAVRREAKKQGTHWKI